MSGPGPNKIPMNIYLTRQHKANLKYDARHKKCAMTAVVHGLLDAHEKRVKKLNGGKLPKPLGRYKAPWVVKQRKAQAKRRARAAGKSVPLHARADRGLTA